MKILHTIPGFGLKSGGVTTCTYNLVSGLNRNGCSTDILSMRMDDSNEIIAGNDESWIKILQHDAKTPFGFSQNMKQYLIENNDIDLYHNNGLWLYCNHITAKIARRKNKPYIISPHGMLYPRALNRSYWKKKLLLKFLFNNDIASANCIHTTSNEEYNYYRRLGYKNPVAIIPNPVPLPLNSTSGSNIIDKKRIGYLGRIHPVKNIDKLIYAWNKIENNDKELVIIGEGDESYTRFLKNEIKALNVRNVIFKGFLSGKDKDDVVQSLTCIVVPSDFENFGMIVPEALMQGVPVIASKNTPWEELNIHNCGWWIDDDVETLAKTIDIAINIPEEERVKMGENGRRLVYENYSIEIVSKKMIRLYNWIINGGEKPEFVHIN